MNDVTQAFLETNSPKPKTVLRLPDLDQAKFAVLNSLTSADAQRGYWHANDEFVDWYCSEPRLSFSRTVVLRYRIHLESRHLAPGTINLRFQPLRRLAKTPVHSDSGLACGHATWRRAGQVPGCTVPTPSPHVPEKKLAEPQAPGTAPAYLNCRRKLIVGR